MSRILVALLLGLLAPSSAMAARAWDPPALITPDALTGAASEATDGTVATAWSSSTQVVAKIGSGAPVVLDTFAYPGSPLIATANAHETVVAWKRYDGNADQTYAAIVRDGVAGTPSFVGAGQPVALAADPAGDMTIVVQRPPYYSPDDLPPRAPVPLPADDAAAYRPAGGTFGALTALPVKGYTALTMSPDGEAVFGIANFGSSLLVTRAGEGPMVTHQLLRSDFNLVVGADAHGRRIAAGLAPDGTIEISTRTADGTWTEHPTGIAAAQFTLATNADGDAVLVWYRQDQPVQAADVSLADGNVGTPATLGDPSAYGPSVAVAPDGSALVAWYRLDGRAIELEATHRDGTGPFGAVLPVGCAQGAPVVVDADTLYAGHPRGGWSVSHSHASDADAGQTCVPDPGPTLPFPKTSSTPILAGVPVRLDASGAARNGAPITSTTWSFGDQTVTGTAITHTFDHPGWYLVPVRTVQGAGDLYVDQAQIVVFSKPGLEVKRAGRRSLRVHATGVTNQPDVRVAITARRHGHTVGHATALVGPHGADVTVRLHRARGRLTVILRQAGHRLAVVHPRVSTSP